MSNKEEQSKAYIKPLIIDRNDYLNDNDDRWELGLDYLDFTGYEVQCAFEAGWDAATKEALYNSIWCRANGDYLPPKDKPVIVLIQHDYMERTEYVVSFAHIVDTSLYAGSKYIPKDYNGWNIPDVKYWLDLDLPKEE